MALEAQGSMLVFRAVLDNRTQHDWYMRSTSITVNAMCANGLRHLTSSVHFTNDDLATSILYSMSPYVGGSSLKPGENSIQESLRHADLSCKFDSLGPVRFKGLKPVDDTTQKSLNADRRSRQAIERLNALQPTLDRLREDDAARRRAYCHTVYVATANKKVSDLTVAEAQEVQACQTAGYYH